jgi:hypothetical protein
MSLDKFLATLFEPGEVACFTDNPNGYRAYEGPADRDLFFSINPLLKDTDLQPTKSWHSPNVSRRADCNVSAYRNLLLEIDDMVLTEQVRYIQGLVPVSSIVYSGSRSHHFILSLKTPFANLGEYQQAARRLHRLVTQADPTSKNPSRLSRLPFRTRPETGLEQKLVYLGERIDWAQLDALLPQLPTYKPRSKEETRTMVSPILLKASQDPHAIMQEFNIKGRNAFFYWLYNRMNELDLSPDARQHFVSRAYSNLRDTAGFSFEEACMAARIK